MTEHDVRADLALCCRLLAWTVAIAGPLVAVGWLTLVGIGW